MFIKTKSTVIMNLNQQMEIIFAICLILYPNYYRMIWNILVFSCHFSFQMITQKQTHISLFWLRHHQALFVVSFYWWTKYNTRHKIEKNIRYKKWSFSCVFPHHFRSFCLKKKIDFFFCSASFVASHRYLPFVSVEAVYWIKTYTLYINVTQKGRETEIGEQSRKYSK